MHEYRNFGLGLACEAKGQCCYSKKSAIAKIFPKKKTEQKCKVSHATTLQKRRVKIMYLGLDIIIKLKLN